MPDPTPTHNDPLTDAAIASVRLTQAARDVERALVLNDAAALYRAKEAL